VLRSLHLGLLELLTPINTFHRTVVACWYYTWHPISTIKQSAQYIRAYFNQDLQLLKPGNRPIDNAQLHIFYWHFDFTTAQTVINCTLKINIHSFIHSRIYKAPLQEIYSEAPPSQPRRYRSALSNIFYSHFEFTAAQTVINRTLKMNMPCSVQAFLFVFLRTNISRTT